MPIFGCDILYDILYLADWTKIGKHRQGLVDCDCTKGKCASNLFQLFCATEGPPKKDGILCKAETKNECPCVITQVHTNGTVRIQHGSVSERPNIRIL